MEQHHESHSHHKAEEPVKQSLYMSAAILIAGAFVAGAILWNGTHSLTGAAVAGAQPAAVQPADISKIKIDGEPFIGDANAPATMAYWTDYQCPFCQRNEQQVMPQIVKDYVDTGKLKIVFKDYPFLGPDSITLGEYGRAVWETNPGKFYDWHKAIFDAQGQEGTGWATKAKIDSITTGIIGAAETAKVDGLVASNKAEYDAEMNADKAEGTAQGVTGTPSFITGKELIVGALPYASIQASIKDALK